MLTWCLEWRAGGSFEGQPGWCRGIREPGPPLQICSVAREVRVELAGDVAFQDAHDLADRFAFRDVARDVFAGAFIAAHAGEGVARASREGDRDKQLRQQRLATLRNGACLVQSSGNVATTNTTLVDPRTSCVAPRGWSRG